MVKDNSDSKRGNRCRHMGYTFRLTTRVLLYAPSHKQDSTYHGLCYTSRESLAGTRNSSMGPPKEGSDDPSHHERTLLPRSYISLPVLKNAISPGSRPISSPFDDSNSQPVSSSPAVVESRVLTIGLVCIFWVFIIVKKAIVASHLSGVICGHRASRLSTRHLVRSSRGPPRSLIASNQPVLALTLYWRLPCIGAYLVLALTL